jgi:hypothetical protein
MAFTPKNILRNNLVLQILPINGRNDKLVTKTSNIVYLTNIKRHTINNTNLEILNTL